MNTSFECIIPEYRVWSVDDKAFIDPMNVVVVNGKMQKWDDESTQNDEKYIVNFKLDATDLNKQEVYIGDITEHKFENGSKHILIATGKNSSVVAITRWETENGKVNIIECRPISYLITESGDTLRAYKVGNIYENTDIVEKYATNPPACSITAEEINTILDKINNAWNRQYKQNIKLKLEQTESGWCVKDYVYERNIHSIIDMERLYDIYVWLFRKYDNIIDF